MSTDSKKHHFVPRSLLKNFQNDQQQLFVFDKLLEKEYKSNAANVGCENNFNTVEIDGKKINLEHIFMENDHILGKLLQKILDFDDYFSFTEQEKYHLCRITTYQYLRVKSTRNFISDFVATLCEKVSEWTEKEYKLDLERDNAKIAALSSLKDADEIAHHLFQKQIMLFRPVEGQSFWISDNPVILFNCYPNKRAGLRIMGTDVYFPIASNLLLAFICQSNVDIAVKAAKDLQTFCLPDELAVNAIVQAKLEGKISFIGSDHIIHFNWLQLVDSSRFIYSRDNKFDMAREVIKENPEIKQSRSIGIE